MPPSCSGRRCRGARVEVYERNRPDDTFGWGVVFSDQTMDDFRAADPATHAAIVGSFHHWDDIDVHFRGDGDCAPAATASAASSASSCSDILQERAPELGVEPSFPARGRRRRARSRTPTWWSRPTASTAAMRTRHAAVFEPDVDVRECRFIWLGTTQPFPAFTFAFEQTEHGWFQIHAYQFSTDLSTVIVETREETWRAHGLDRCDTDDSRSRSARRCSREYLDGQRLHEQRARTCAAPPGSTSTACSAGAGTTATWC